MARRRPGAKGKRAIPEVVVPTPVSPGQAMARTREGEGSLNCSFCGKSQNDVRKLIVGPEVYICDECIDLCHELIAEPEPSEEEKKAARRWWSRHHGDIRQVIAAAAKKAQRRTKKPDDDLVQLASYPGATARPSREGARKSRGA
jgi:hypothetical protein